MKGFFHLGIVCLALSLFAACSKEQPAEAENEQTLIVLDNGATIEHIDGYYVVHVPDTRSGNYSEYYVPAKYRYTEAHVWVDPERSGMDRYKIGMTAWAAYNIGDVVYVELPEIGTNITNVWAPFAIVETTMAVWEFMMPWPGMVVDVNDMLLHEPGRLNEEPYAAWIIQADLGDFKDTDLMSAMEYAKYIAQL